MIDITPRDTNYPQNMAGSDGYNLQSSPTHSAFARERDMTDIDGMSKRMIEFNALEVEMVSGENWRILGNNYTTAYRP